MVCAGVSYPTVRPLSSINGCGICPGGICCPGCTLLISVAGRPRLGALVIVPVGIMPGGGATGPATGASICAGGVDMAAGVTVGVNGFCELRSCGRPFTVIICSPDSGSVVIVCVTGFTLPSVSGIPNLFCRYA